MIGKIVSHYRILDKLGKGGMGVVYKAEDLKLGRQVAVKFLPEELSQDSRALERFQREARAISALNHPNICIIHEIDEHQRRHFIVMELLEGESLSARMGGIPAKTELVLQVGIQIAEALTAAQAKGITHRDLKPANIFLTQAGPVKMLDFGLAKVQPEAAAADVDDADKPTVSEVLSTPGLVMGTVDYMSPEQALGRDVDQRTDIFSLGVVLYHMIAGRLPFKGVSASDTIVRIARDHPESLIQLNPAVPAELEHIVRKCLEKDRARRYQSAGDLAIDLKNLQRDLEQGTATRVTPAAPAPASAIPYRRLAIAGIAFAALLLLAFAFIRGWWRPPGSGSPARIEALAVLPLENLSGDPSQDYFADGMTEALIADLGQIGSLTVISRTSVMRYKGSKTPLPEIARKLRVDAVVEGSVVRSGQRVRITANLIQAATEKQLWARSYERSTGDILDLQSELAQAIAVEIRSTITPNEKARLSRSRPVNPDAYQAYLKGSYYSNQLNPESHRKAIDYFDQAIRIEPEYAAAYAGLSRAWTALGAADAVPMADAFARAANAAQQAVKLDDSLAEAHVALAMLHEHHWEHTAAEKELRRAIELNPGSEPAHIIYTSQLRHWGRLDESIAEARRALALDPLSVLANEGLGDVYVSARRYDLAIEQYRKTLELYPNRSVSHYMLGWAYVYKGMIENGTSEIQESLRLEGGDPNLSADLAYIAAISGRPQEARKVLQRLLALAKRIPLAGHVALIYIGLGQKDQAFEWLEKAYQEHNILMLWLKTDPRFDSLRADARFAGLLKKVGLG